MAFRRVAYFLYTAYPVFHLSYLDKLGSYKVLNNSVSNKTALSILVLNNSVLNKDCHRFVYFLYIAYLAFRPCYSEIGH